MAMLERPTYDQHSFSASKCRSPAAVAELNLNMARRQFLAPLNDVLCFLSDIHGLARRGFASTLGHLSPYTTEKALRALLRKTTVLCTPPLRVHIKHSKA